MKPLMYSGETLSQNDSLTVCNKILIYLKKQIVCQLFMSPVLIKKWSIADY